VSRRKPILILLICLILASCSWPKTAPRKELRSDLISAISLASETELFIGQLLEGRATPLFAQSHLEHLHRLAATPDQMPINQKVKRRVGVTEKAVTTGTAAFLRPTRALAACVWVEVANIESFLSNPCKGVGVFDQALPDSISSLGSLPVEQPSMSKVKPGLSERRQR
jgi:hypothetical protein